MVREGHSQRSVARHFGVRVRAVQYWLARARGQRLDRVDWSDAPTGPRVPAHRIPQAMEDRVLNVRRELKDNSDLGEFGAAAIRRELTQLTLPFSESIPAVRTIGRILERRGALDGNQRVRRPPPPRGWFLPDVAAKSEELDSFDIVEDLVIQGGTFINVLNGISLHGRLCVSWPRTQITAKITVDSLLEHWRQFGVPRYAKFDNDTVFQGAHQFPDTFGRVTRLCLALGVSPVFAPPNEMGFQADIENYNGRWQSKVWRRFRFVEPTDVVFQSDRFVSACRRRLATSIETAPIRRQIAGHWKLDLQEPLRGVVIFLRRTSENGEVRLLGRSYAVSQTWCHRLVRAEVDLSAGEIRLYSLRRKAPSDQPHVITHSYKTPKRRFQGD